MRDQKSLAGTAFLVLGALLGYNFIEEFVSMTDTADAIHRRSAFDPCKSTYVEHILTITYPNFPPRKTVSF